MQQTGRIAVWGEGDGERKRLEGVVETLAASRSEGEDRAEVAHDARNMVTALGLYCDLLDEPGVLASPYFHYGKELRLVAAASRRLVEKLVALDSHSGSDIAATGRTPLDLGKLPVKSETGDRQKTHHWDLLPAVLIDNLAAELLANRNLLAALAGPRIVLTVDAVCGPLPVNLTGEDLTRVLVNLVKNAAEAMPAGGQIQLSLRERAVRPAAPGLLLLTIEDSGPGIPAEALESIFEAGFSTQSTAGDAGWPVARRGLGLSITRSIIEKAGGRIAAANRAPVSNLAGARLTIELPVRTR